MEYEQPQWLYSPEFTLANNSNDTLLNYDLSDLDWSFQDYV